MFPNDFTTKLESVRDFFVVEIILLKTLPGEKHEWKFTQIYYLWLGRIYVISMRNITATSVIKRA